PALAIPYRWADWAAPGSAPSDTAGKQAWGGYADAQKTSPESCRAVPRSLRRSRAAALRTAHSYTRLADADARRAATNPAASRAWQRASLEWWPWVRAHARRACSRWPQYRLQAPLATAP